MRCNPRQEPAEGDREFQIFDREIGALDRRHVKKHQRNTGDNEDQEQNCGDCAEPERVVPRETLPRYFGRKPVQQKVSHDGISCLAISLRQPRPFDLVPGRTPVLHQVPGRTFRHHELVPSLNRQSKVLSRRRGSSLLCSLRRDVQGGAKSRRML